MAMSKWNPFREGSDQEMPARRQQSRDPFRRLQQEMNQVFENFFGRGGSMMRQSPGQSMQQQGEQRGGQMGQQFRPQIDVSEDAESLTVTAELPGLSKDDIELYCDDDSVTIKGEKQHEETKEEEGFYRQERSYGFFQRTIPFPVGVDTDNADAQFQDGVLHVRFPKTGESRGKRLEIQ